MNTDNNASNATKGDAEQVEALAQKMNAHKSGREFAHLFIEIDREDARAALAAVSGEASK